jgi:hypothetical protein
MAILDDLKGLLSPAEFAKIEGNAAIKARVDKADELYTYYAGADDPPPAAHQDDPPPARRETPPPAFSLDAIERMLDAKLGAKLTDTVKTQVEEVVKTRGDELYNNVRAGVRSDALQLVKIYTRHNEVTGKSWDDAEEVKFNDFLKANNEAVKTGGGKRYATLTEAYNDYIAPVVTERTIATEVDKRVKAESGKNVPGTTPAPSTNSNIRFFKQRSVAGGDGKETGAQRAAALLDQKMNSERSA